MIHFHFANKKFVPCSKSYHIAVLWKCALPNNPYPTQDWIGTWKDFPSLLMEPKVVALKCLMYTLDALACCPLEIRTFFWYASSFYTYDSVTSSLRTKINFVSLKIKVKNTYWLSMFLNTLRDFSIQFNALASCAEAHCITMPGRVIVFWLFEGLIRSW